MPSRLPVKRGQLTTDMIHDFEAVAASAVSTTVVVEAAAATTLGGDLSGTAEDAQIVAGAVGLTELASEVTDLLGVLDLPYIDTVSDAGPLLLLTNSSAASTAIAIWGVANAGIGVIGSGAIGVQGIATGGVGVDGNDNGTGTAMRARAYQGLALRAHVEQLDGTITRSAQWMHYDGTLEKIIEGTDVGGTVIRMLTAAAETLAVPRVQKDETVAPGGTIAATTQIAKVTGSGVVTLPAIASYPAHAILTVIDVSGTLGPGVTLTVAPAAGDAYLVAPGAIATAGGSVKQFHDGTLWYTL